MLEKRVRALEAANRKLRARVASLQASLDKVTSERDAFHHALQEERIRHQETRRVLDELYHAVTHADESMKALLRRQFGASSEQLQADQHYIAECLDALDPETREALTELQDVADAAKDAQALADSDDADDTQDSADAASHAQPTQPPQKQAGKKRKRPSGSGGRLPFPEHLERIQTTYAPPDNHPALINARSAERIGTATSLRFIVPKLSVLVEEITYPVMRISYARGMHTRVRVSPPAVVSGGQVGDSFLVESACDKVMDHLPAYRQSNRIAQSGVTIARSKLCRWHQALADFLDPVAQAIFEEIHAQAHIGIDDTVHRLLIPNAGACTNGRMWAVATEQDVYYQFHETREGKWIDQLLANYNGDVMGDAYAGHAALLRREGIRALFCWAHVRRKFFDAHDSPQRAHMLDMIAALYRVETTLGESPPESRRDLRQREAMPLLTSIKHSLDHWHADKRILPKSGLGKAVRYALPLWDGLTAYADADHAPIDNNHTERCMRGVAMHRKNSLFSASIKGANAYATLLTITQSAHLHNLNVRQYMNDIIDDIHHSRRPIAALTPTQYAKRQHKAVITRP